MTSRPANYCPDCGAATTTREIEDRERRYCPDCETPVFQNPAPCADVTVVDGDRALLVERAAPPGVGEWSIPGGHLEADESPRAAAVRELREETGVEAAPADLELLDTALLDPFRGKYVVSIGFAVSLAATEGEPTAGSDAAAVRFFSSAALAGDDYEFRPQVRGRVETAFEAVE